jgi:hypothetical protein
LAACDGEKGVAEDRSLGLIRCDMHFVKDVTYISAYKLLLTFEDGVAKLVDLEPYLDGEIFEPLRDIDYFKTVHLNPDIDTIVWDNDADLSPDFLYEIGVEQKAKVKSKSNR